MSKFNKTSAIPMDIYMILISMLCSSRCSTRTIIISSQFTRSWDCSHCCRKCNITSSIVCIITKWMKPVINTVTIVKCEKISLATSKLFRNWSVLERGGLRSNLQLYSSNLESRSICC